LNGTVGGLDAFNYRRIRRRCKAGSCGGAESIYAARLKFNSWFAAAGRWQQPVAIGNRLQDKAKQLFLPEGAQTSCRVASLLLNIRERRSNHRLWRCSVE
jgi:hypothetical protein